MSRTGGDEVGSVLVDALVAIGIMTLALGMGAEAIGAGARRTGASQEVRLATLEARSRLAEVGADIPLEPGRASGEDGALDWSVDIEPAGAGLLAVHVAVSGRESRVLATLDSVRAGPG